MISNFQNTPTWLVVVFLVVWIFGGFFLSVKKWKNRKPTEIHPKKEMIISLMGLSTGIGICYLTVDWVKNVLLSGLSGIHAGFVACVYVVVLLFISRLLVEIFWKFSKNILSEN